MAWYAYFLLICLGVVVIFRHSSQGDRHANYPRKGVQLCRRCKRENVSYARYCANCGMKLDQDETCHPHGRRSRQDRPPPL